MYITFLYISKDVNCVAAYGNILTICAPFPLYNATNISLSIISFSPENTPVKITGRISESVRIQQWGIVVELNVQQVQKSII